MSTDKINVTITEKELINVDFEEKEILEVIFKQIDRIGAYTKLQTAIQEILIFNEKPTQNSDTEFETTNEYVSGTLRVYINGIREQHITETSNQIFTTPYNIEDNDDIIIDYVKVD
jgi:hypothetical protein